MRRSSFCVFVISHGRPNAIVTIKTLKRSGYSGPIFVVCDNEDKTLDQYQKNYGRETVLVFDKIAYAKLIDSCDNFQNRRTTTHARNACFDLAKAKGFDYFLVLDDDYSSFMHNFDTANTFSRSAVTKFDSIANALIRFLDSDERIDSVCFIQGGDLIGGDSSLRKGIFPFQKRKAMNSFFCKTSRRFWFFSRLNEDVNTYLALGSRGRLFFSIPEIALNQAQTQATAGGMSDAYLASGTYVKSFYSVMINPSFAKVSLPHSNKSKMIRRIHHQISWNNAVPKILNEGFRKA